MLPSLEQPDQCLAPSRDAASLVLEAERDAMAAIEHCRQQVMQSIAQSHAQAELLRERTASRIARLHERMAAAAQVRQEQIHREMAALAGDAGADASILALLDSAIARVAEELAGNPGSD